MRTSKDELQERSPPSAFPSILTPPFCPPHGQVLHESIQYGLPMQHFVHPGTQFPAGGLTFLGCVRDWTQPCCLLRTLF